jgi:hypothetical protein
MSVNKKHRIGLWFAATLATASLRSVGELQASLAV